MHAETEIDYRIKYEDESKRLAKLWVAYESQEKEIAAIRHKIAILEREVAERDRIIKSLKEVLEARDRDNREMEIELTRLKGDREQSQPRIEEQDSALRTAKTQYAKLFVLAEELEEEVSHLRREIEVRDEWFRTHVHIFSSLQRAIEERERMIASVGKRHSHPKLKELETK